MIYITGDSHGYESKFANFYADDKSGVKNNYMKGESEWGSNDKVIICGDFSYIWYDDSFPELKSYDDFVLDVLENKPYEILFVDGNHENFDELYKYPEVIRYGDKVHKIRENIYHLERGRVYTIEGKKFFTFGGGYSLDKEERNGKGLNYDPNEPPSWWEQEMPKKEEYERGMEALKSVNFKVDYIVTHTAPTLLIKDWIMRKPFIARDMKMVPEDETLRNYLDIIWGVVQFKRWFFGHWHIDEDISERARALLNDVEAIP
ncbi:MAG: metallophosphoesterase [Clostridia bacterium]|nr:metallophosphoesterase [Clostridia bacterium]